VRTDVYYVHTHTYWNGADVSLAISDGLVLIKQRAGENQSLATLITMNGSNADPGVALVNAAVVEHPITNNEVVAFVGRVGVKLANLRATPRATLMFQAGWEWVAVRGPAELSGPDDPNPNIGADRQRRLLRDIYIAAGGQHHNLDDYDQTMIVERRCVVLVDPEAIWTNPSGSEHREPEETQ